MTPIGAVLREYKNKVDRDQIDFADLQPITVHFDGSIDRRDVESGREYRMDLFFAPPGHIVVAKIDLKNGAVGIVPNWANVVVTNHFAVYRPDCHKLVPEYLIRLIQTSFFKAYLWYNKVGVEGRKEVKLDFFESIRIPLLPLKAQRAIVNRWEAAQAEIAVLQETIQLREQTIRETILRTLGVERIDDSERPKVFALQWSQVERWSVEYLSRMVIGANRVDTGKYPALSLGELCDGQSGGTPYKSNPEYWGGDIPWVSPKDMKTDEICGTQDYITKGAVGSSSAPLIAAPSVLVVVRSGILQRLVPVALNRVPVSINQDLRAFTPKDDRLLADFLACYLQARQPALLRLVKWSTTVQSINKEELESFPVPLPPLDVQHEIVRQAKVERAEIVRLREQAVQRAHAAQAEVETAILGQEGIFGVNLVG